METTLHQQLKEVFREPGSQTEVKFGRYRIDVVNGPRLVEIQQSGLAAIRRKVGDLLNRHPVDIVKPLVLRKRLVKLDRQQGAIVDQRWSPRRGSILDLFDELLYFTRLFPHPNLRIFVPLIEIEEIRYPGHGRRRRRRDSDYVVQDRALMAIHDIPIFTQASDLHGILPGSLAEPFDTAELARGLDIPRWAAQRMTYVMRKTGALQIVAKRKNANLYQKTTDQATDDTLLTRRAG